MVISMFILFTLIGLFFILFYLNQTRNKRVCDFIIYVSNLCYFYDMKNIVYLTDGKMKSSYNTHFNKLPSYLSMVYSFKPLKLESYFSKLEIGILLGEEKYDPIKLHNEK